MKVSTINFENFGVRGKRSFTLPHKGLVLVTGPNGSGKSSIPEAVSYAVWGKTLRSASLWSDEKASVECGTSCGRFRRTYAKGSTKLKWSENDYVTATAAKEDIKRAAGEWKAWRRSCVFSLADNENFTSASDSDKKRLLESLLGLERFDKAQAKCLTDKAKAETEIAVLQQKLSSLEASISTEKQRIAQLLDISPPEKPTPVQLPDIAKLPPRNELAEKVDAVVKEGQELAFAVRNAKNDYEAAKAGSICYACKQPLPDAQGHDVIEEKKELLQNLMDQYDRVKAELRPVQEELRRVDAVLREHSSIEARNNQAQVAYEKQMETHLKIGKAVFDAESSLISLEDSHDEARLEMVELLERKAVLTEVAKILGTRGVRVYMLKELLQALTVAANYWLGRLDLELTVEFLPYKAKKSGGTSNCVDIRVSGRGDGSYSSLSQGERKRIDIAVALALGDLVPEYSDGSTLFFDEIFDGLDTNGGIQASVELLHQLAEDRCVVVITHRPEIIQAVKPTMTFDLCKDKI